MDHGDVRNATKKAELEACVALADNFKSGEHKEYLPITRLCVEIHVLECGNLKKAT